MSKTLAGRPLAIGVEGEELVIRIGVDTMVFAFETGEENQPFDEKVNDFRRTFHYRKTPGFGTACCICNSDCVSADREINCSRTCLAIAPKVACGSPGTSGYRCGDLAGGATLAGYIGNGTCNGDIRRLGDIIPGTK